MQKKSCQHQHYGIGGTGKHETGKDRTSEYWHLTTFRKSCQCRDVGSQLMLGMWCESVTRECDVEIWWQVRLRMFVSINLCVDLAYTLFIQSIYPLHRQSIIHQPKSIDVIITTPRALGRCGHTRLCGILKKYPHREQKHQSSQKLA